jgi:hypothetical protein
MKNLLLTAAVALGIASATLAQVPNYVPTNGLVGWWPFNGNANDESGNGNDGTVNGATLTEDRLGNANGAYSFDGVNDFISTSNNISPQTEIMSISVWFNADNLNNIDHQTLLMRQTPSGSRTWLMIYNDFNNIRCYNENGNYTNNDIAFDIYNSWHHFVAIYDGIGIQTYIDGEFLSSQTVFSQFTWGTEPVLFGGSAGTGAGDYPLRGTLDDIGIWNRALTQEEITALYTGETSNPVLCNPLPSNLQNGLVGYWPFCGNANDESGNGNDGTVNGAILTEDRLGNANEAYSFDGVDDFIEIQNSASLTFDQNTVSISFWINVNDWPQPNAIEDYIISKHSFTGNNQIGFHTYIYGGNNTSNQKYISFRYRDGISSVWNQGLNYTDLTLDNGNWYNVIYVHDNNFDLMFFNGILVDSTNSVALGGINSAPLLFGCLSNFVHYYNGTLDDIGIWNRALTSEEVQQLYTGDVTSVNKPSSQPTVAIFPNPSQGQITIDFGSDASLTAHQVFVQTIQGQQIYSANIVEKTTTMNLGDVCGKGLYFVHVIDPQGNTIDIRKIVLQ